MAILCVQGEAGWLTRSQHRAWGVAIPRMEIRLPERGLKPMRGARVRARPFAGRVSIDRCD